MAKAKGSAKDDWYEPAIVQKIGRAKQHLNDLNDAVESFVNEDPNGLYRLHGEAESKRGKHRLLFSAELLRELPMIEWGIRVGDAIHCLRSALDQLVYGLSSDPDGSTAFPISNSEKDWVTKAPLALWGVAEPFRTVIDRAQPYHRGDAAHTHPFAILSALSNADKHRYIPIVALVPERMEWGITSMQGIAQEGEVRLRPGVALKTGAVIAELPFTPDASGLDPQVQMDGKLSLYIAFDKTPGIPSFIAGHGVTPVVGDLINATLDVVEETHEAIKKTLIAHGVTPASPPKT